LTVAVLFTRANTPYRQLGADVWGERRDARTYAGRAPVVAHPPCRTWGRLSHFAKAPDHESALSCFAVRQVQRVGGVLEHPAGSKLWDYCGLPQPGRRDEFGGFTLPVLQSWWGHRAPKPTWLYIVGIEPEELPAFPFALGIPEGRVEQMCKAERERTPPEFAAWLLEVASRCRR
jgi:hypothetical protein